MALVTRQGKGSKLTIQEMDDNLLYLEGRAGGVIQVTTYSELPSIGEANKLYIVNSDPSGGTVKGEFKVYYWNSNLSQYIATGFSVSSPTSGAYTNTAHINFGNGFVVSGFEENSSVKLKGINVDIDFPDTDPGYKVYRAKIATKTTAWPGYGYLYNWYAVADTRGLANPSGGTGLTGPDIWQVPTEAQVNSLFAFVLGEAGELKSTLTSDDYPFLGWLPGQFGDGGAGTDLYNFNVLPGGSRDATSNFLLIGNQARFWTSTDSTLSAAIGFVFDNPINSHYIGGFTKGDGHSIRLVRGATMAELLLNDGDTSETSELDPYTGNDGTVYVTVKIGTQIWLAQNLRETKYNDNSDIFNASALIGGAAGGEIWAAKSTAQEGAWTVYQHFIGGQTYLINYDPTTIIVFYNDVLENTFGVDLKWLADYNGGEPNYSLQKKNGSLWQKTHIKLTQANVLDSESGNYSEKNLMVANANGNILNLGFKPFERNQLGAFAWKDLNNYSLDGGITPFVYLEIIEYPLSYYNGQFLGIGVSNLE